MIVNHFDFEVGYPVTLIHFSIMYLVLIYTATPQAGQGRAGNATYQLDPVTKKHVMIKIVFI